MLRDLLPCVVNEVDPQFAPGVELEKFLVRRPNLACVFDGMPEFLTANSNLGSNAPIRYFSGAWQTPAAYGAARKSCARLRKNTLDDNKNNAPAREPLAVARILPP